jgi:hypothetical protein
MKKVIEYNGKKLEIIAFEGHDMPKPYYNYWVREILEKKHWWGFSRKEILHGNTFWWKGTADFETVITQKIKEYYDTQKREENFDDSVKKFFEN